MITDAQKEVVVQILTTIVSEIVEHGYEEAETLTKTKDFDPGAPFSKSLEKQLSAWKRRPIGKSLEKGLQATGEIVAKFATRDDLLSIVTAVSSLSSDSESARAILNSAWYSLVTTDGLSFEDN